MFTNECIENEGADDGVSFFTLMVGDVDSGGVGEFE
jgi:hypothetical protein